MNIAAAIAALRLDADPMTKHAAHVLACRADRYSGRVTRSVRAIAADMGASERTAQRAIRKLGRLGYLQVAHSQGIISTYALPTHATQSGGTPVTQSGVPLTNTTRTDVTQSPLKRKTGERQEGAARPLAVTAAVGAVDSAASTWQPTTRAHPPGCRCGGSGWVDGEGNEVARCED